MTTIHHITFISTIHKEIGKCNAKELCKIITRLNPEVIFLEAIDETYSEYEKYNFETYGVYHHKLEISAIQKYSQKTSFYYVPVCEIGLSHTFRNKLDIVCKNREVQKLIDNFNYKAAEAGFLFLNSLECIRLQEEMRALESQVLNNIEMEKIVNLNIDAYENPMIRNIYSYCKNNIFSSAVFMCGAAHRKSIIQKLEKYKTEEKVNITWTVLEN